jgi:hypothetical protein
MTVKEKGACRGDAAGLSNTDTMTNLWDVLHYMLTL